MKRDQVTAPNATARAKATPAVREAQADNLAKHGHRVMFNPHLNGPGLKNPDVAMDGEIWEFKAPLGSGKNMISNQFKRARKQSDRLVLDMARSPLDDVSALAEASQRFYGTPRLTEMIFIGKDGVPIRLNRS